MSLNFLRSNGIAGIVTGSATYFGATGTEIVKIVPGTVVTTDQNIERIEFSGNVSDYSFSVSGNQVKVLSNGAVIETFAAGGNNQVMAFANGSAPVVITGLGVVALGGSSLPAIAGPLLVAPTLNTADPSTVPALIASMTTGSSLINSPASLNFRNYSAQFKLAKKSVPESNTSP
jgi:hypothetical protein